MSCYEWESGKIKIPARQWKSFCAEVFGVKSDDFVWQKRKEYDVGGDASIILDDETRTVIWDVPENNHARENARKDPLARALFRALGAIKWTRDSGGVIAGNDEYNRDDLSAGAGGNYEVAYYGPVRKRRYYGK